MKIIIRNRPFLLISQVLLASYLPAQFNNAQAASAALTEAPPPWAARQDAQASAPVPQPKAVTKPKAVSHANSNNIEAWYQERQALIAQAQPKISKPDLEAQAEKGDLKAQYALALQLRQTNTDADLKKSLQWQEKAARAGHVEAQYGLGVLYSNGQYVAADQRLANFWYTQAAKRGSEAAKLALASLPVVVAVANSPKAIEQPATQGLSTQDNSIEAVAATDSMFANHAEAEPTTLTEQSVASPTPVTATNKRRQPLVPMAKRAPAETVEASPAETVAELPLDSGAAGAEGVVGIAGPEETLDAVAEAGDVSVEHNESKVELGDLSVSQIVELAKKGDMYAQLMLGALFEDGSDASIPQSYEEAAKWYAKAARQGYPKAQHNLALLYEDGKGVQQNYEQAAIWYQKAAKAGFSEAQNNLAVLYIMGNGVKQNRAQAEKLLTAAVAQGNENARRNLQKLLEGAAS